MYQPAPQALFCARYCARLCALLPALLAMGPIAMASEQCFLDRDLVVPQTSEGLYVNLVNASSGQTEASVPGFDIDLYAAASSVPSDQLKFYWGPSSTGGAGVATVGDTYAVLAGGAVIGPESLFTRAAFTGNTEAWQAGVSGYLGLRFRDEADGGIRYGWMLLSTTAPLGFPALIDSWCYEDSGAAITIPSLPTDVLFRDHFEG